MSEKRSEELPINHPNGELWQFWERQNPDLLDPKLANWLTGHAKCKTCLAARRQVIRERNQLNKLLDEARESTEPGSIEEWMVQLPRDYKVQRFVPRGGQGVVLQAEQDKIKRLVAVKRPIRQESGLTEEIRQEARVIARLIHENIVVLHDFGEWEGRPYFTMQLMDGSLAKRLDELGLPNWREAVRIVLSIASAVQYAHKGAEPVLHCDIKPGNVLFNSRAATGVKGYSSDDEYKLTDFGQFQQPAVQESPQNNPTQAFMTGTPGYQAPEQIAARKSDLGPATDIFGLGALLYCLLTNDPPMKRRKLDSIELRKNGIYIQDNYKVPISPLQYRPESGHEADLDWVCLKCLEADPSQRYRSVDELINDLQCVLDCQPLQHQKRQPLVRLDKWRRRSPWLATTSLAVIVAGITALVFGISADINSERAREAQVQAETQRGIAEIQRDKAATALKQAELAQRESEDQSHRRLLAAIDVAERRGDWANCLAALNEAIKANRGYTGGLKLRRARSLFAMGARDLPTELACLGEIQDQFDSSDTATWKLLQGDLLCAETKTFEQGRALVRQALEDGGLTPADAEYAEALLADHDDHRIAGFRAALALDGFHHRARAALALNLFVTLRPDDAYRELEMMRLLFPDDANAALFRVIIEPFLNVTVPNELSKQRLAQLYLGHRKPLLPESEAKAFLQLVCDAAAVLKNERGTAVALGLDVAKVMFRLQFAMKSFGEFNIPLPPSYVYGLGYVMDSMSPLTRLRSLATDAENRPSRQYLAAARRYGWASVIGIIEYQFLGFDVANLMKAQKHEQVYEQVRDFGVRLRQFSQQAIALPGAGRSAAATAVVCDFLALGYAIDKHLDVPEAELAAYRQRIIRNLSKLFEHSRAPEEILTSLGRNRIFEDSDPEIARLLLLSWKLSRPSAVMPIALLARIEHRDGNRGSAVEYAKQVLKHPQGKTYEAEMRAIVDER